VTVGRVLGGGACGRPSSSRSAHGFADLPAPSSGWCYGSTANSSPPSRRQSPLSRRRCPPSASQSRSGRRRPRGGRRYLVKLEYRHRSQHERLARMLLPFSHSKSTGFWKPRRLRDPTACRSRPHGEGSCGGRPARARGGWSGRHRGEGRPSA